MAEKKKNSSTRERIIENAKKHFYCDGYSKTRMQDIADDTGIALGSLSYHFKKKEAIVSSILKIFLERLYDHTLENTDKPLNALELHFYASIPYYENLLTEENTKRFYYEFTQAQSVHSTNYGGSELADFITEVYHQSLKDYHIFVDDAYANMAQKFGYGGRVQMVIDYVEGALGTVNIAEMANFLSSSREMLLGVPKAELDRIGQEAITFNREVDFSNIMPLT
ncbi:hypothetical protein EUCA11A_10310 [Eubacterium callanderi]|uniref:TetR/AcrR family transcriptional regulator n=1 Tax=Eubacterium callanderi TaxID=53442 RepID=UPI0029FF1323|nr:TetR/AcrR family transcriptional regulator [Eubacterium callanderi]WPK66878.1 hypothetical protein EUCA2A_10310 [Eubacterium callanderi]WPK71176.1 hypothetical protein EUCA11A_10310 [Eubacterium callanderi]